MTGTHRIQRVPDGEKNGRRHSSTVVVVAVDTADTGHEGLDLSQVRLDYFRGSGAGGQHRNKTDSCCRAVHLPTGITVVATESRSQHQNRAQALARLDQRLRAQSDSAAHAAINETRQAAMGEGRSWSWTSWRDEVKGPDGHKGRMSRCLSGRLDPLLG